MERASRTLVTDFVFVRFSNSPRVQLLFFSLFLLIHLSSLVGSALIVHTAAVDGRLHTPMYLFICNLSLVELWYTTVTVPKMPANSLNSQGVISGLSHISQYYFFSLATAELFILTTMAFDVALPSANHSSTHCCSALRLGVLWLGLLACGIPLAHVPLIPSYTNLLLHPQPDQLMPIRLSAFLAQTLKYESNVHKIVAIFYSVITPLLSPLIYTLRNKDVKEAVKVLVSQI
ncbi:olfactory receptor 6Q1-like protein [Camelus ferus]|nr:olfactory receptor 6Q1-like protein [Camelus ferus]